MLQIFFPNLMLIRHCLLILLLSQVNPSYAVPKQFQADNDHVSSLSATGNLFDRFNGYHYDLSNNEHSARQPSCAHKVQTSLLIATDLSREDPNFPTYRQKAAAILKSFVSDFNFLPVVPRDQISCEFNESLVENRALISGTFYTNSTTKEVINFCHSNFPFGYIDSIISNPFHSGPLNISGVLVRYGRNFKDQKNLDCRCTQNNVNATSKIVVWLPMQASSTDPNLLSLDLNSGFTDQFHHLVIPFGFNYTDSPLWQNLQPNAEFIMPRGDMSTTSDVVDSLRTQVCILNERDPGDATAEPPAVSHMYASSRPDTPDIFRRHV